MEQEFLSKPNVELRVVPPPRVSGVPWETASNEKGREALLGPLTMRERAMVCAIVDCIKAFEDDLDNITEMERQGLLGLMRVFEDATGCKFVEAEWNV